MVAGSAKEQLIFSGSIEALMKVVAAHKLSAETMKALAAMRMGPGFKIEPAYPARDWAKAVKLIGAELFPGLPPDEQHRQLGKATVLQFADSLMGRAMFAAAKVIGARRSLERMSHNLRTGANFIETRFTVIDDRTQELWINDVSEVPGFYAGMLIAGADQIQGWSDHIELKAREGTSALLVLTRTR